MPFSFPSSPTAGQQSVQNGRTFSWSGYAWELVAASGDDARWDYFKPAAPTGVTATATNAQAVVSWTAPAIVVPPVTDYSVQFSTDGGSTWTTASDAVSTATSATITSLANGAAHVFRVAGINGIGTGPYSAQSAAVTPTAGDPLFSSVSLLLHMDGSGNTFTDSSGTPKTITAVGGATQSAAESRWGGKSALFNGSTDGLTVPNTAGLNLAGVDWTIEAWLYPTSTPQYTCVVGKRSGSNPTSYYIYITDGIMGFYNGTVFDTSHAINANQWTHIAWSMSSGTLRAYAGGARVGEWPSVTIPEVDTTLKIGRHISSVTEAFAGYIDDLRITKGHARYTGSTLTVPTAAFLDS
jgi:hypothetical protein